MSDSDFPGRAFLRTRRLRLRELCLADVPGLIAMNRERGVADHLVEPCPTDYLGNAKMVLHANVCYVTRPGLGVWHASDEADDFVGVFSLMPIDGTDEVEIGTRLRPAFWGRLLPIEGGRALCAHAFETVGLSHLVGLCHPDNAAVPAILRRLGFAADGRTLHFDRSALRFVLRADAWRASGAARRHQRTISSNEEGRSA